MSGTEYWNSVLSSWVCARPLFAFFAIHSFINSFFNHYPFSSLSSLPTVANFLMCWCVSFCWCSMWMFLLIYKKGIVYRTDFVSCFHLVLSFPSYPCDSVFFFFFGSFASHYCIVESATFYLPISQKWTLRSCCFKGHRNENKAYCDSINII